MMGGKTPKTCWAVNKRQDNKLENCCIRLVIYLKPLYMSAGKLRNTERPKLQCYKIKVNLVESHRVHGRRDGQKHMFIFNQTFNNSRSNTATIRIKIDGNIARQRVLY
jgi:hypothetical protein